ncbi:hypothetical protein [Alkanindiges hydrocarboniclasticus]|uniref:hypothetical protein n=1 Tax=Alkanindiges hydrocarboniclasticus TaxID=1907941 RepID=UPI0011774E31|nr:hypothetical protein [Alkanindiges hydrocarboniclasticus]
MKTSKACVISLILLVQSISKTAFAHECIDPSLTQYAKQSLLSLFGDHINLNANSRFPFLGKVLKSTCSTQHTSCQVLFEPKEIFFDLESAVGDMFGIPEKSIQDVFVIFDGINGTQFPVGSEWFAIPENYGSSDGHGSGFVFNTSCGSALASYKDGNLILLNGKVIPYADVKRPLSEMINPKSIERLKNALHEVMINQK